MTRSGRNHVRRLQTIATLSEALRVAVPLGHQPKLAARDVGGPEAHGEKIGCQREPILCGPRHRLVGTQQLATGRSKELFCTRAFEDAIDAHERLPELHRKGFVDGKRQFLLFGQEWLGA